MNEIPKDGYLWIFHKESYFMSFHKNYIKCLNEKNIKIGCFTFKNNNKNIKNLYIEIYDL